MEKNDIYGDISKRTNGDIYIGVVGPVRTGKSTFISKFIESTVLPNISNKLNKQIATDEMPQSGDGKMIMTTQPKFIPANAVKVQFKNKMSANFRLVDCVGYFVDGAIGDKDGEKERLVKTPWSDEKIPFYDAAEIGTKKVIDDYSTIGIVVTTDGSIGDIPRENYVDAEEKVVDELKAHNKPFIIVLNCKNPNSEQSQTLAQSLEEKYGVCVYVTNVLSLDNDKICEIMSKVLMEFPMSSIDVDIPTWMRALDSNNFFIKEITNSVKNKTQDIIKMKDYSALNSLFADNESFTCPEVCDLNMGDGVAKFGLKAKEGLFYKVLSSECQEEICDEFSLMSYIKSFSDNRKEYVKIKDALNSANENGYGVVMPNASDMSLCKPEMYKQGGKYGVKFKASAPSLHIMKVDVTAEVSPIVGNDKHGADIVKTIENQYSENPEELWNTNMFGKSLHELVENTLKEKVNNMPNDVKTKLKKTTTKIVNENKGGLICILL